MVVSAVTHDGVPHTFPARFPNIFVDYPLGQMCVGVKTEICCSRDNDIITAQVWEPNQQLLSLVNLTRVVSDNHFLSDSFYSLRCSERSYWI